MYLCTYMNTYMYIHIRKIGEAHIFCFYDKTFVFCLPIVELLVWGLILVVPTSRFGYRMNHAIGFHESPACKQHMAELHDHK